MKWTGLVCSLAGMIGAGVWGAFAAQPGVIRIGYFPNVTHGQALYARATGSFEKQLGLKVQWVPFNAGPTAVESLFANAIDATYVGPGPTVNGYIKSRGEKFVVVAGAASGGAGLVVRQDAGIAADKDFDGKKIATPQLGNTQDISARSWLSSKKFKLREKGGTVTLMPIANPDQLVLFQKKEIDAAWTVEPWLSRLELEAGGKLYLDEKTLWPQGKYVTTHLVVTKAFQQKNADLVKKLLQAHVDATQALNKDRATSATLLNAQLSKETGKDLKPEVVQRALERVEFTWDPISNSLHEAAEKAFEIGFLKTKPNLTGIYSLDPLNEVLKEKQLPAVAGK
jgi:NitT/TauT family transport system substrate-binding protein